MHPKLIQILNETKKDKSSIHKSKSTSNLLAPRKSYSANVCAFCKTTTTPLWRKVNNQEVCNACGIYWRTHQRIRPILNKSNSASSSNLTQFQPNFNYPRIVRVRQVYSYQELQQMSGFCVLQGSVNQWMNDAHGA